MIPAPADPQSLNRYTYVMNQPLRWIDPTGHAQQCSDGDNCSVRTSYKLKPRLFLPPLRKLIRSGFGYGDPTGGNTPHPGVDYSPGKDASIHASSDGKTIVADPCGVADCTNKDGQFGPEYNNGYGNVAIMEYSFDALPELARQALGLQSGRSVYMLYAHMKDAPISSPGTPVGLGQMLGEVGSTGNSTGAHLHYEVRIADSGTIQAGVMCSDVSCGASKRDPLPRSGIWNSGNYPTVNPSGMPLFRNRHEALDVQMMSGVW